MMSTVALTEAALLRAALASIRLDYETQTEPIVSEATRYRLALAALDAIRRQRHWELPRKCRTRPTRPGLTIVPRL